jgi:hypothetical protein
LGIRGNQYGKDVKSGATVAEWNLIRDGFGIVDGKEKENMEL